MGETPTIMQRGANDELGVHAPCKAPHSALLGFFWGRTRGGFAQLAPKSGASDSSQPTALNFPLKTRYSTKCYNKQWQ